MQEEGEDRERIGRDATDIKHAGSDPTIGESCRQPNCFALLTSSCAKALRNTPHPLPKRSGGALT